MFNRNAGITKHLGDVENQVSVHSFFDDGSSRHRTQLVARLGSPNNLDRYTIKNIDETGRDVVVTVSKINNKGSPWTAKVDVCPKPVNVLRARRWRVYAAKSWTKSGNLWDVSDLSFYSSGDCRESSRLTPRTSSAFSSGTAGAGYGAHHAIDNNARTTWGGRPNDEGEFFVGVDFRSSVTVKCIKMNQKQGDSLLVQSQDTGCWNNVSGQKFLKQGDNTISFAARRRLLAPPANVTTTHAYDAHEDNDHES